MLFTLEWRQTRNITQRNDSVHDWAHNGRLIPTPKRNRSPGPQIKMLPGSLAGSPDQADDLCLNLFITNFSLLE